MWVDVRDLVDHASVCAREELLEPARGPLVAGCEALGTELLCVEMDYTLRDGTGRRKPARWRTYDARRGVNRA